MGASSKYQKSNSEPKCATARGAGTVHRGAGRHTHSATPRHAALIDLANWTGR